MIIWQKSGKFGEETVSIDANELAALRAAAGVT
jgi:hypothetical protein